MNIALCDDHEIYVSQLHEICEQTLAEQNIEHTIYEFHSGKELLECDIPMQILLIDQRLGDTEGIEVCREIRQRDQDVIIIFVSDYAEAAPAGYRLKVSSYRFKQKLKSSGEEVTLTSEDVMILHFATLDQQMKESLLTELGEHKIFHFEYSGEGSFSIGQVFESEIDSESDLED